MPATGHIAPTIRHAAPTVRYLRRREIEIRRWDECIINAVNPLVYGRSFYLDEMAAGQWDALVLDDYNAVMPLTWRSKFGIRYLYQPAFTQQTGIFSAQLIPSSIVETFLRQLDRHFRFAEIYLNYSNAHPSLTPRTNYVLHLDAPYEQLAGQYKKDLARNLKAAHHYHLTYIKDFDLHTALNDFRREYASRIARAIGEKNYRQLRNPLAFSSNSRDRGANEGGFDKQGQSLCSAVFLRENNRLFDSIHSTTLPAGRSPKPTTFSSISSSGNGLAPP